MVSYLTDADLKVEVAAVLKLQNTATLPPQWDKPIAEGNAMAMSDITGALLDRGFTEAQIASWDRGPTIHKLQALYWTFVIGAAIHNFDDRWVNKWDQRAYLKVVPLDIDGSVQSPNAEPGLVEVGQFNTKNDKWSEENMPW